MISYVEEVTGKTVICRDTDIWKQEEGEIHIYCEDGVLDMEGLLHELSHYIVATEQERQAPNLMLGDHHTKVYDVEMGEERRGFSIDHHRSMIREHQARFLEYVLFEDLYSKPELADEYSQVSNNPEVGWYEGLRTPQEESIRQTIRRRMAKTGVQWDELKDVVSTTDMGQICSS